MSGRTTSAIRRSKSRESLRSVFQPFQQTPLRLWKQQPQPQPSPARRVCRVREFEQPCRAACAGSRALRGARVPRAPSRFDRRMRPRSSTATAPITSMRSPVITSPRSARSAGCSTSTSTASAACERGSVLGIDIGTSSDEGRPGSSGWHDHRGRHGESTSSRCLAPVGPSTMPSTPGRTGVPRRLRGARAACGGWAAR